MSTTTKNTVTSKFTKRISMAAVAAVVGLAIIIPSTACNQQKAKCASGRGDFFARYTFVSGSDACQKVKGEKVGIQTYNAIGENQNPDLDHASIAIESLTTGTLVDNATAAGEADSDTSHKPYALGSFTTPEPGDNDICAVPTLAPAVQDLPEVKADDANQITAQPATNITYEWSNVNFYVTPAVNGTEFSANVTVTTNGDACVYTVQGLSPYVDCSKADPADPTGSGINPDFPVHCDPDLLVCVLNSDGFPVLN